MLKDQIVSEVLANRDAGVMKIDDDYELDSLAKLEVVAFLENIKEGFLDNSFDAVADASSLDAILAVFDSYQIVSEVP
jgi:hypothetical protein